MRDDVVVIRMFAGWAESELWYGEPVPYPQTGLPADLLRRLSVWAAEHYRRVNAAMNDGAPDRTGELQPHAVELAREVADELGDRFAIEVDDPDGDGAPLRIRSAGPPRSPTAAAALTTWVEEIDRRQHELDRVVAEAAARGEQLRWVADRPDEDA